MPTALLFLALLVVLLFTQPAFAISYSASVGFDLASLTFSGIPISFSTVIPPGTFDPFLNDITADQRNTFIFAGTSLASHESFSSTWGNGGTIDHNSRSWHSHSFGNPCQTI